MYFLRQLFGLFLMTSEIIVYYIIVRILSFHLGTFYPASTIINLLLFVLDYPHIPPCPLFFFFFFFNFYTLFIYLFLTVLGLCFCARAFSSCGKRRPLFIAVRRPLTVAASLVAEHRLQTRRLSTCGSQA